MSRRAGLTLVEVLMATVILGTVLVGLMQGMTTCLSAFSVARRMEAMQAVLSLGEVEYPFIFENDPVDELTVSDDPGLKKNYVYSRICEEDEDEDGLYLVRTTVKYGRGGPGSELTVVRYVFHEN